MKKENTQKGITLIALIITIIVLLILAAVTIGAVQNDGIIQHAKNSRKEYQAAQTNEQTTLGDYLEKINENISSNSTLNHRGTIPKGGTYTTADGTVYNAGEEFPAIKSNNDSYTFNDHVYVIRNRTNNVLGMYSADTLEDARDLLKQIYESETGASFENFLTEQGMTEDEFWTKCMLTEDTFGPAGGELVVVTEDANKVLESIDGLPVVVLDGTPIPKGAVYETGYHWYENYDPPVLNRKNIVRYAEGYPFPEEPSDTDHYRYNGLIYKFNIKWTTMWGESPMEYWGELWGVCVSDRTLTTCGPILDSIAGKPVVNLDYTFWKCTSLTGTIEINCEPTSYIGCFNGVDFEAQNLTLSGTSSKLDEIGATGTNYCAECNGKCLGTH